MADRFGNRAADGRSGRLVEVRDDRRVGAAMPTLLRDAHKTIDRTLDKCDRAASFESERNRVECLFDLYQKLSTPLTADDVSPSS